MRLGHATLARGFTLIELMIGVAIFALLTVLAVPMYGDFMANTQVRTAAESVLTGIRLAQSEAVRRGIPVRFELVGSTGWQVVFLADDLIKLDCGATTNCISDPHIGGNDGLDGVCNPGDQCIVRAYNFSAGAPYAVATALGGTSVVTFTSLGVVASANQDGSLPLTGVSVAHSTLSTARQLNVIIGVTLSTTGGTKLCDPSLAPSDIAGCPAS